VKTASYVDVLQVDWRRCPWPADEPDAEPGGRGAVVVPKKNELWVELLRSEGDRACADVETGSTPCALAELVGA